MTFSVFTKSWKMPLPELGQFVKGLGFDGIELPVRPGFQVEPDNVTRGLPEAARILADCGVRICSISGPVDEPTLAACQAAGVRVNRVGVAIERAIGYMATEAKTVRQYDALLPLLERYQVTLGVQNHAGAYLCNAMGIRHLVERYDPKHVAAVLDFGHCGLDGEIAEQAIDIVWSHLCMVFLKNAIWRQVNGPEAEVAQWQPYWTSGRHGLVSWPAVASELARRGYQGVVCLTAEYSDHAAGDRLIAEDIAFAKSLFA